MKTLCITRGIFYCREGSEINGSRTYMASYRADSLVFHSRQQKYTANR
jgi:hypothetical protein